MKYLIKELRNVTGLTQKDFANMYDIPLSTLRKWEQGESSPAPYVLNLIAKTLPATDTSLMKIEGSGDSVYYYSKTRKTVSDVLGNIINIHEELDGVKEQNLVIYLQELFEDFYDIQEKFNRDCRYDKKEEVTMIQLRTVSDSIEIALDEADKAAIEDSRRMSHEEVFSGLRRAING